MIQPRPLTLAIAVLIALPGATAPVLAAGNNDNTGSTATAAPQSGFAAAQAAVDAGRYPEALKLLAAVVKTEPRNADALNLMGYSNRKMKRLSEAARYYEAALKVDPKHIGALEYQGELFVETGDYDRARQNLKLIGAICGACEEAIDLRAALDAKGQS
jgi:tetratricopeptide (TPR) repeat protein